MKLNVLTEGIAIIELIGDREREIDLLSQDTRDNFTKKTLYFAVPGTQVDGHDYIDEAIEKGAHTIVCESLPEQLNESVTYLVLESVLDSMGSIASHFYQDPSEKLSIIAVTGTNGKTTVASTLYQSLLYLNKKVALFSTAGDFINGEKFNSERKAPTSMEIIELHKNLKNALDNGCEYVCLEATSHALDQKRLNGTKISGAIYTNLTQDHLDYHNTIEEYASAKKKLFDLLDIDSYALVNIDDSYGATMISDTKAQIISYGDYSYNNPISRDLTFDIVAFGLSGTEILLDGNKVNISLVGRFNMYNIVSVYGTLVELGFESHDIISSLEDIKSPRGRMEIITGEREGVVAIVDYAHSPDALENVLATLSDLPHNKITTVVGVGGDRDRKKRPEMARIAQEGSDYVFFTSDNPRTEDVDQIFNDLLAGCDKSMYNYEKIIDRENAIKKAIEMSESNDIILVAGKGHEDYQIIGTTKHHFDDREMVKKYL